jgi:hypothetical protein
LVLDNPSKFTLVVPNEWLTQNYTSVERGGKENDKWTKRVCR